MYLDQSLVGSVVIDAEFGREDHGSIPATAVRRSWNHLMSELTSEPDSTGSEKKNIYLVHDRSKDTISWRKKD
jgi:hypothetical protein